MKDKIIELEKIIEKYEELIDDKNEEIEELKNKLEGIEVHIDDIRNII